jgi:hypothetical protein
MDINHPFLFLSNCLQNPLGLCFVSVWNYIESYIGIVSGITVQKRNPAGILGILKNTGFSKSKTGILKH